LATFNFGNFNFVNFRFWQPSILKLSVLTISNLGYFQAKFLNGSQEEEQQEQHIDCMDLAIKNQQSACITTGHPHFHTLALS
jgi:hypothetical protein